MKMNLHIPNSSKYAPFMDIPFERWRERFSDDVSGGNSIGTYLEQCRKVDETLNAFIHFRSQEEIHESYRALTTHSSAPLMGVPFSAKDLFLTAGMPTTAASLMLEHFVAPYTATVVQRVVDAGAVLVGKNNQDEFAHGATGEYSAFGPTKNPWNPDHITGGSSSGSAAAVAAGMVPFSLGTDTGGSVRAPASHCGVVGFKPTYGRLSRYGVIAMSSSLDCPGVLANTVDECAQVYRCMAGVDPYDLNTYAQPKPEGPVLLPTTLRVGVPQEYLSEALHPDVRRVFDTMVHHVTDLGWEVVPVTLPHTHLAVPAYYILVPAEISSNLARYDGIRYAPCPQEQGDDVASYTSRVRGDGFGPEVTRRILVGTFTLSAGHYEAYYQTALKAKGAITDDFHSVFDQVDLLLSPVMPSPAYRIGEKISDPVQLFLEDILTAPASLAGIPAMSLKGGFSHDRLPIGVQVLAPWWQEERLISVASHIERTFPLPEGRPVLSIE